MSIHALVLSFKSEYNPDYVVPHTLLVKYSDISEGYENRMITNCYAFLVFVCIVHVHDVQLHVHDVQLHVHDVQLHVYVHVCVCVFVCWILKGSFVILTVCFCYTVNCGAVRPV